MTIKKWYKFIVSGFSSFPTDMLRYDKCWPGDDEAVNAMSCSDDITLRKIARDTDTAFRVTLHSFQEPTAERWRSFGWLMELVEEERC